MSTLHRQDVRLAPWMGVITPAPEQAAFIEHALDHARSWLRYGERRQNFTGDFKAAPILLHPRQAA